MKEWSHPGISCSIVAEKLGLSKNRVYTLIRDGKLKGIRSYGILYVDQKSFAELLIRRNLTK